jgi:tetratricopeptide (TPR) repeat protein
MSETQRYRVNYRLLAGLVIGAIVTSVGAYFLWNFQVERNADRLLAKAEAAEAKGEELDSYESLDQYVRLRTHDKDARLRLGKAAVKVANDPNVEMKTRYEAYNQLSNAVTETDDPKLRRELIEIQMKMGYGDVALRNIDELLAQGHGDAELKSLKAECLFGTQKQAAGVQWSYKLIGFDPQADAFDAAKAEAPHKVGPYWLTAMHLRQTNNPAMADRVMNQMVEANPESREAQLLNYRYKKVSGDNEGALAALDEAYRIEPTDPGVLLAKGSEEILAFQTEFAAANGEDSNEKREEAKKRLDVAAGFFAEGLKQHPDRLEFYYWSAQVESMRENFPEALSIIERGLKEFPLTTKKNANDLPLALDLVTIKVQILFNQQKYDDVKLEVKALRGLGNSRVTPVADFHEARLLAVEEKWADAAKALADVKVRLFNYPEMQAKASADQAFCHERLGQFDLAIEAYEWALKKSPGHAQAQTGLNNLLAVYRPEALEADSLNLDAKIRAMAALPEAEQDWDAIYDAIDAYIDEQPKQRSVSPEWVSSRKQLLRGQVLAMRAGMAKDEKQKAEFFLQARDAIRNAYAKAPNDPTISEHAVRLLAQEPGKGPAKALELLDTVVEKQGDRPSFRLLRIDLLSSLADEQLPAQLEATTQNMDKWQPSQQALIWQSVAMKFEQMGKFAEASRYLEKAVELAPNSLPSRMALFDLALKQGDDAAMDAAQKKILEVVKSETDPGYVLSEVRRRIVNFGSGVAGETQKQSLREAREMLDRAIKQRPSFADLYVASGQLMILLDNDVDKALAEFDKALENGPANLNALNLQIRLLAERGRFREARQRMDRMPAQVWAQVLEKVGVEILRRSGDMSAAYDEAVKVMAARPNDAASQVWFADVASQFQKLDEAETALLKAVELEPGNAEYWYRLVTIYQQKKNFDKIEHTLREAHLALDEEFIPALTARYYELQGRWQEAEDLYLTAFAGRLEEPAVAQRMAEFYITWMKVNEANRGKAAVYLNRLLRANYEGKLKGDSPLAVWGRQQASKMLSQTGDYQDSLKAERLLSSADRAAEATPEDREYLIDILSLRGDPGSRERVIALLRKTKEERGLTPERELHLGHALYELGLWEEAQKQMEEAIGRFPNDARLQTAYTSMFIGRKDFRNAERWLARLNSVPALARPAAELQLRLYAAQEKKDEVRRMLESITPDLRVLTPEQLEMVHSVAKLAINVGDYEYGLQLMREFARRAPGNELELAEATSLYGPLDEGLTMLKQLFDSNMDAVGGLAVNMLRKRRAEDPARLDEEVGRFVRAALRDDPESARRMVMEAEMMEIQERYDESIAAYRKLLARDDVPKMVRAQALNNIAFLLALKKETPDEALAMVNEAIDIVGPISDILDTRALVHTARGDYAKAIEDMNLAIKVGPTASKYFHLVVAHLGAGDEEAALVAWKKAEAEGIAPDKVSKLERESLQQVGERMQTLRTSTAQL